MKTKIDTKVIYYDDELNDDFAGNGIKCCKVDESYKYLHTGAAWRFFSFIIYYLVAFPLVWFFERVIMRVRFVNGSAVRRLKGTPCFLYGNHTGWIDAFTPNLISLPRRNRIVVSADTVSIKGLRTAVEMLGAIPVPTSHRAFPCFKQAISHHRKRDNITIYPEAHIWPYFTGVRNFTDASFTYPAKEGCPVFAFFTAYSEPHGFLSFLRRANMTVYVSDPIYAKGGLSEREARQDLRDKVHAFMLDASKHSTYKVFDYKKSEEDSEVSDSSTKHQTESSA